MIKPRSSDELNSVESNNEERWTELLWQKDIMAQHALKNIVTFNLDPL